MYLEEYVFFESVSALTVMWKSHCVLKDYLTASILSPIEDLQTLFEKENISADLCKSRGIYGWFNRREGMAKPSAYVWTLAHTRGRKRPNFVFTDLHRCICKRPYGFTHWTGDKPLIPEPSCGASPVLLPSCPNLFRTSFHACIPHVSILSFTCFA